MTEFTHPLAFWLGLSFLIAIPVVWSWLTYYADTHEISWYKPQKGTCLVAAMLLAVQFFLLAVGLWVGVIKFFEWAI